jgi:hypothetical protein
MTIEVARYQFHSWARRGMSANIIDVDDLGAGTVHTKERAEIEIALEVNAEDASKHFALIGPGDIIGINRDMVVRTEPINWITDFEPNYLAFVEFYDEDFAWRYTPAKASGEKLRPWVALLVLEEDEFDRSARRVPLPSIKIKDKTAMPKANELWLWAHMHSNADIPDADLSTYERFLNSLNHNVTTDPDGLFCRLMSPRHLEPNTGYYAFVVPTFETGRLAGLGQPTADVDAQQPSWASDGAAGEMPVYYEWFFRTGANEDFESLAKRLEPRTLDPHVGIRDMDCSAPGFVKADGSGPLPATSPKLIGLEGALKSPMTVSTVFPNPPAATAFQDELQTVVNLGEQTAATAAQDPIVTMPLYGKNHARRRPKDVVLLDVSKSTWLHDLNKDPRTRTMGGCGTLAIQNNQERYMRAAWLQVEKVNDANRRIRGASATIAMTTPLFAKTVEVMSEPELIAMTRPLLSKVKGSPTTLLQQLKASNLPVAAFSSAFRRITRPGGALARKFGVTRPAYGTIVTGLNDGTLTAAPDRSTPTKLPNTKDLGDSARPNATTSALWRWLLPFLFVLLFLLLLIALPIGLASVGVIAVAAVVVVAAIVVVQRLGATADTQQRAAELFTAPESVADQIAAVPARPGFNIRLAGETVAPPATPDSSSGAGSIASPSGTPVPHVAGDSLEARNFRVAAQALGTIARVRPAPEPERVAFALSTAQEKMTDAVKPRLAHGARLDRHVKIPGKRWADDSDPITEVMAYPDFEEPMYKKLVDQSDELLLPNLKLIPPNTISLLQTNQKVIEAYMVGLNHEMGRELLWREYPTDQRGSYFRQFWDVTGVVRPDQTETPAELSEKMKDITPIHTWKAEDLLGAHNNRDTQKDEAQIVLVVRGDLLKRYPNSVVFAQKAIRDADGERAIDLDLTASEFTQELLFPLYRAELLPDIKLFGFDLTAKQARGDDPSPNFPATDKEGWFFVIQEVPGEPRFGMDIDFDPGSDGLTWDDLSWKSFPTPDPDFITAAPSPVGGAFLPTDNAPNRWATSSANMAYVLFQKPSMIAAHAADMLKGL